MTSDKRKWFAERAKLFEYYVNNMSDKIDEVNMIFHEQEYGWVDTDIVVNENNTFSFSISFVYQPFDDILKWLENLAENRYVEKEVSTYSVCINAEDEYYIFVYEPDIGFIRNDAGIFYVYADECVGGKWVQKIALPAYCCKTALIHNFYKTLTDFAMLMNTREDYRNEWMGNDREEIDFQKRFHSSKIINYLSLCKNRK